MKEFFSEGKKNIWKFHQLIHVETGARNAAIIDFANGNVYHVEKNVINLFKKEKFESISNFLNSAIRENLVIFINEKKWIPYISLKKMDDFEIFNMALNIDIENGADLDLVREKFENFKVKTIFFLGGKIHKEIFPLSTKEKRTLNFDSCFELCKQVPCFTNINISLYEFYINFNPCWGKKIVITKDNMVKPCFFSDIIVGNLAKNNTLNLLNDIKRYWRITKDKIERCKDCEFRYICFDCREIARKKGEDLYSTNPYCRYNPYDGVWSE